MILFKLSLVYWGTTEGCLVRGKELRSCSKLLAPIEVRKPRLRPRVWEVWLGSMVGSMVGSVPVSSICSYNHFVTS